MKNLQVSSVIKNLSDNELMSVCEHATDLSALERELLSRFETAHNLIMDMKKFAKLPKGGIPHGYDGS